jgi:NAD-dependent SIR2 family protein deacetylase
MAMRTINQATLIRYLSVMNNGEIDFFMGSGASAQAGIPTGGTMIWDFKRELYCTENSLSKDLFKDLYAEITRKTLQNYFDSQGGHPALWAPEEYAHYFELCHPTSIARERYIQSKVNDISPSIGHLCLGDLFIKKKVVNVWTTNFDELVEAGIKTLAPHHSFNVYSGTNKSVAPSNALSSVIKLHGDYRYDHIKNTPTELQSLEASMQKAFSESLVDKGLVVVGYSGSDESIMSTFEAGMTNSDFLKYGLIWTIPEGVQLSVRLSALMEKACQANENSGIVQIQDFDKFMHSIYAAQIAKNDAIENLWKDYAHRKLPISFQIAPTTNFTKLNAFESTSFPSCMVFDTDISSWKQLREVIGNSGIIAALYARRVYCFDETDEINRVFDSHVKSLIEQERVSNRILYRTDSIYIGMLYSLIKKVLISEFGMIEFRRNKYYDPTVSRRDNDLHCLIYEAIEISLSVYKGKIYLNTVPTVFVTDYDGNTFERFENQRKINSAMSKVYNGQYNKKLKTWNLLFSKDRPFSFSYKSFSLSFNRVPISSGGVSRVQSWPTKTCYHFSEPEMQFSVTDISKRSVNQLKGISKYAPLDCSYYTQQTHRSSIELAIISPQEQIRKLLNHLAKLNQPILPRNRNDGFLTQYSGFDAVFKRGLSIPAENDTTKVFLYSQSCTSNMNEVDYSNGLKRNIDRLAGQNNFDIAVIYIPAVFSRFRENHLTDFNLHDAIKLYATDRSVKVQFIEERSTDYYDQCKVMWGLSTSLYAKATGVLWQPVIMNKETAFIGVSYAISKSKGTCIGCSQLFDSTGTGIRLLLRKIDDPGFWGRNPYMKSDEARSMMSALRDQYYKCDPTNQLKRIVVHKTTPFTQEEIKGFTQALEGIDDIELLQIQEYASWRAIRYDTTDFKGDPARFAIHRGTAMPLNDDCFLLWTHGCIQHNDLSGSGYNYYKGGRGIPSPLLVKRFYGKASGDVLVNEILMLSKMNWNSGDSLYKQLPVTLDFAKVLSRMSKQDEAIYNNPYDFRYFM